MAEESIFQQELQLIHAIYFNEILTVESIIDKKSNEKLTKFKIDLKPNTAMDNKRVFVYATLIFTLNEKEYPKLLPTITFNNTKGLEDSQIADIITKLQQKAVDPDTTSILLQVIELAVEILTSSNSPSGDCSICLSPFNDTTEYMKTENCFHSFHCNCFAMWWQYKKKEIENDAKIYPVFMKRDNALAHCPMCRTPISEEDMSYLEKWINEAEKQKQENEEEEIPYVKVELTQEQKDQQKKFQELFQRQVTKEGIIGTESTANDSTIVVNNLENRIAQLLNEHANEAAIKEFEDTTEITSESSTSNSMANTSSSTGSKKHYKNYNNSKNNHNNNNYNKLQPQQYKPKYNSNKNYDQSYGPRGHDKDYHYKQNHHKKPKTDSNTTHQDNTHSEQATS